MPLSLMIRGVLPPAPAEAGPRMSTEVTKTVFERVGISARKLRGDRIYDEARHTGILST